MDSSSRKVHLKIHPDTRLVFRKLHNKGKLVAIATANRDKDRCEELLKICAYCAACALPFFCV